MKKRASFTFMVLLFFLLSCGQNSYHVKPLGNKGSFIYSPGSKLKLDCKTDSLNARYRYHYVYIDSLAMTNGNYFSVLNLLENAEYFYSKHNIDDTGFDTECYSCLTKSNAQLKKVKKSFWHETRASDSKMISRFRDSANIHLKDGESTCGINTASGTYYKIKYSFDRKAFLLQLDYKGIINGHSRSDIEEIFFVLAKDLLIEFSKREGTGDEHKFGWPLSISQSVIEQVFQMIPVPARASLARYICRIDTGKSFILLNPKIKLKVDIVEKIINGDNWRFNLLGTTFINIHRNNTGKIIQNPFLQFEAGLPDNKVEDNSNVILQASTGDIQFSETLRECPFVFLYQMNFKKNNKASSDGACTGAETELIRCNSQLWHFDQLDGFYKEKDLDFDVVKYISTFGYRNLISPIIEITVNGNVTQCPLGLNLSQLRSEMSMPSKIKIYRLCGTVYKTEKL